MSKLATVQAEDETPGEGHNSLNPKHAARYAEIMKKVWVLRKEANSLAREAREIVSDNGYDKVAVADALSVKIKKPHEKDGYTESYDSSMKAFDAAEKEQGDLFARNAEEVEKAA